MSYPFDDPVAIICNEEGKLNGLDLNRALRNEDGVIYDIVAGTFLAVGLGEEDFASLDDEHIQQFSRRFKTPEMFVAFNGKIMVLPMGEDTFRKQKRRNERGRENTVLRAQMVERNQY